MSPTLAEQNKATVLEAFEVLFNKRDYVAAEKFWSPEYIQHSAHIAAGRAGLFELTKALPSTLRYENALAVAEGEFVILHGRFSGHGLKRSWIVADIVRLQDGLLVEHWDVIQDEATKAESKSGRPMFGSSFALDEDIPAQTATDQPKDGCDV
jgi:predicted SnoaL-like aldol condensation-catalyzing enzyme